MWPAHFRVLDASELSRAQEACSRFIASINPQCVLGLASRYRANSPCSFYKPLIWGTNNVCFFVGFDDGEKWVIRLPFPPTLALGARDKLETEVAMMQYVKFGFPFLNCSKDTKNCQVDRRKDSHPDTKTHRLFSEQQRVGSLGSIPHP